MDKPHEELYAMEDLLLEVIVVLILCARRARLLLLLRHGRFGVDGDKEPVEVALLEELGLVVGHVALVDKLRPLVEAHEAQVRADARVVLEEDEDEAAEVP